MADFDKRLARRNMSSVFSKLAAGAGTGPMQPLPCGAMVCGWGVSLRCAGTLPKMLGFGGLDRTGNFVAAYMRKHFALHHRNGIHDASLASPG